MRKSIFIKHLQSLNEAELREELERVYDNLDAVRLYYKMELGSQADRQKHYEKARKTIEAKFKTKSYRKPRRPRIQKLNLYIKKLEKSAVFPHELIDVYLHTVETAIDFMVDYNYSSKPVINTAIKYFEKGLEQIRFCRLEERYEQRCRDLLTRSRAISVIAPAMESAYKIVYP